MKNVKCVNRLKTRYSYVEMASLFQEYPAMIRDVNTLAVFSADKKGESRWGFASSGNEQRAVLSSPP